VVTNKEIQHLDKSRVKLSITVGKEDAEKEYRTILADYAKKAQIDGFRKGKVPPAVLERKFGEGIKAEAGQKVIEDSLKTVFEEIEEKPLPYSVPELDEDFELSFDKDFSFSVTYDVFPKIELGAYTGLDVEEPVVKISAEDEKRELQALVEQNSFIVEKDGAAAKEDIATVGYWEIDEKGEEVPNTRRQDFVFTVGSGGNPYGFDDDIVGMKKGDNKIVKKDYPADYPTKELTGKSKTVAVELSVLKEKKKPEVNDELAQDISEKYKTVDDLKKDIRKRLDETMKARVRSMTIESLMDQVAEKSTVPLPESMVQAELQHSWNHFVSQFRMKEEQVEKLLQIQGRTKEVLFEEWRPNAEKSLKVRLLIEKMIEAEKIEAGNEEVDAFLKEQAEESSMKFEELKEYYTKNNLLEMARHDVQEKKLFDLVLGKNAVKKGKKLNFVDMLQGNR
jgi:trigger factor